MAHCKFFVLLHGMIVRKIPKFDISPRCSMLGRRQGGSFCSIPPPPTSRTSKGSEGDVQFLLALLWWLGCCIGQDWRLSRKIRSHSFEMQGIWTMTKTMKTTKTMMAVWDDERAKMWWKKETTLSLSLLLTMMTTTSTKGRRMGKDGGIGMVGVHLLILGGDGKEKGIMTMMTRIAKHERRRGDNSATQLLLQQAPGQTAEVIQEWQEWERDQQRWQQCNAMLRTKPTECDGRLKRGWWWWWLADGKERDTQLPWRLFFGLCH